MKYNESCGKARKLGEDKIESKNEYKKRKEGEKIDELREVHG